MRFDEQRQVFIATSGEEYSKDEVVYSKPQERHILRKYAVLTDEEGIYVSQRALRTLSCGYVRISPTRATHVSNAVRCTGDTDNWVYKQDAFYDAVKDEYFQYEKNIPSPARIQDYHNTTKWRKDLRDGAVAGIGFEVEKTSIKTKVKDKIVLVKKVREYVGNSELFTFERDGSCGAEMISHILPLGRGDAKKKVFEMFDKEQLRLSSPVDSRCGGHVGVSIDGTDGKELQDKLRKFAGILYSLFTSRLNNFSLTDLRADSISGRCVFTNRKTYVECRLPSAVVNVEDLRLRYNLFLEIVGGIINKYSFNEVLRRVEPTIGKFVKLRESDDETKDVIVNRAKSFQHWIETGTIDKSIQRWVDTKYIEAERKRVREQQEAERQVAQLRELADVEEHLRTMPKRTIKLGRWFFINVNGRRRKITLTEQGLKDDWRWIVLRNVPIHSQSSNTTTGIVGITEDGKEINWERTSNDASGYWKPVPVESGFDREPMVHELDTYWANGKISDGIIWRNDGNRYAGFSYVQGDTFSCRRWGGKNTFVITRDGKLKPVEELVRLGITGQNYFAYNVEQVVKDAVMHAVLYHRENPATPLLVVVKMAVDYIKSRNETLGRLAKAHYDRERRTGSIKEYNSNN